MGVCKNIDHFPEDAEYEQDAGEYLLRAVRASSLFPIMSVGLLFIGGMCVAASEFYKNRHNVILSAGIFFVSAGLSNIVGIIVYISANSGDPNQSDSKRSHWYGWSFYCGAFSFIISETVGALTVHLFINAHRGPRYRHGHASLQQRRSSSYRSRYRARAHIPSRGPLHRENEIPLYQLEAEQGYSQITTSMCMHAHSPVLQPSLRTENGGVIPAQLSDKLIGMMMVADGKCMQTSVNLSGTRKTTPV